MVLVSANSSLVILEKSSVKGWLFWGTAELKGAVANAAGRWTARENGCAADRNDEGSNRPSDRNIAMLDDDDDDDCWIAQGKLL